MADIKTSDEKKKSNGSIFGQIFSRKGNSNGNSPEPSMTNQGVYVPRKGHSQSQSAEESYGPLLVGDQFTSIQRSDSAARKASEISISTVRDGPAATEPLEDSRKYGHTRSHNRFETSFGAAHSIPQSQYPVQSSIDSVISKELDGTLQRSDTVQSSSTRRQSSIEDGDDHDVSFDPLGDSSSSGASSYLAHRQLPQQQITISRSHLPATSPQSTVLESSPIVKDASRDTSQPSSTVTSPSQVFLQNPRLGPSISHSQSQSYSIRTSVTQSNSGDGFHSISELDFDSAGQTRKLSQSKTSISLLAQTNAAKEHGMKRQGRSLTFSEGKAPMVSSTLPEFHHKIVLVGTAPRFDIPVKSNVSLFPPPPLQAGFVIEGSNTVVGDTMVAGGQLAVNGSESSLNTPRMSLIGSNTSTNAAGSTTLLSDSPLLKDKKAIITASMPKGINIVGLDKIQLDVKPRSRVSIDPDRSSSGNSMDSAPQGPVTRSSSVHATPTANTNAIASSATSAMTPLYLLTTRGSEHTVDVSPSSGLINHHPSRKIPPPLHASQSAGEISLYTIPSSPIDAICSPPRTANTDAIAKLPRSRKTSSRDGTHGSNGSVNGASDSAPDTPEPEKSRTSRHSRSNTTSSFSFSPRISPFTAISVSTGTGGGSKASLADSILSPLRNNFPDDDRSNTALSPTTQAKEKKDRWFANSPLFRKKTLSRDMVAFEENGSSIKQLFSNVVFCFSGLVNPQRAEVRSCALRMGAKYGDTWSEECTHLICTNTSGNKWKYVFESKKGHIVRPEWVIDTFSWQRYLPESLYAVVPLNLPNAVVQLNMPKDPRRPHSHEQSISNHSDGDQSFHEKRSFSIRSQASEEASTTITPSPIAFSPLSSGSSSAGVHMKSYLQKQSSWMKVDDSGVMQYVLVEKITSLPDFLSGVVVVFDDTILPNIQRLLQRHVIAYDGQIHTKLSSETTYFCTDRLQMDPILFQLSKDFPKLHIVSSQWILSCHASGKRLPIDNFHIS